MIIHLIACEEYMKSPSGGANDIKSDLFGLTQINADCNLILINKTGNLINHSNGTKLNSDQLSSSILYFSGFLSAERLFFFHPFFQFSKNKKIINTKDLHFYRELRKEMILGARTNHESIMKRELQIYKMVDLVLSYSDVEAKLIKNLCPSVNIQKHYYYDESFNNVDFYQRSKRLVFAGNFQHQPNLDGLTNLLINDIHCLENIGFTLDIYGPHSELINPTLYKNFRFIKIHGIVENSSDIYKEGGFAISPIRFGGGIKIKIIEAALSMLPIIATIESIENLPLKNNENCFIYKNNLNDVLKKINNISDTNLHQSTKSAHKSIRSISNKLLLKRSLSSAIC